MRRVNAITLFGVCALSFMMVMYALERRLPGFVAAFALGWLISSAYSFLSGVWPFGVVEAIWALVAHRTFLLPDQRTAASASRRRFPGNTHSGRRLPSSVPVSA